MDRLLRPRYKITVLHAATNSVRSLEVGRESRLEPSINLQDIRPHAAKISQARIFAEYKNLNPKAARICSRAPYRIAVDQAQAIVEEAKERMTLARAEAVRRAELSEVAVSKEQKQIHEIGAATAAANYQQPQTRLSKAELDLSRTEVRSPVDGWITNLSLRQGDYAISGQRALSVVDAHSFWVEGYFEETTIGPIEDGDPASVWLMGFSQEIKGHVDGLIRAINVPNAQPNAIGVAEVNPVFTWVRLAQHVPVRIHLDLVPENIRLVQA